MSIKEWVREDGVNMRSFVIENNTNNTSEELISFARDNDLDVEAWIDVEVIPGDDDDGEGTMVVTYERDDVHQAKVANCFDGFCLALNATA